MDSGARRSLHHVARALVIAGLVATAVPAQSIRVNANGGGNYTDLQAALDASPAGATIRVQGGTWGPIVVRRSVRLIGEPTFEIFAETEALPGTGGSVQAGAIRLEGSGADNLEISHATIHGRVPGGVFTESMPGISGFGFASLRILSSVVEGPRWQNVNGGALGQPAIQAPFGASLLLADSIVLGASSLDCCGSAFQFGPRGAPALDASGSEVTILDCHVQGGDGVATYWSAFPPSNTVCPCPAQAPNDSQGGPGVIADTLLEANSTILGGRGGEVWYDPGTGFRPWGRQPDGPDAAVFARTTWSGDVTVSYGRHLGETILLKDNTGQFSLVLIGALAARPLALSAGQWFYLDPTIQLVAQGLPPGGQISIPVPRDVFLIGQMIGTHFLGAPGILSRPLVTVVRF